MENHKTGLSPNLSLSRRKKSLSGDEGQGGTSVDSPSPTSSSSFNYPARHPVRAALLSGPRAHQPVSILQQAQPQQQQTLPSPKKKRGISFASLPSPYRQKPESGSRLSAAGFLLSREPTGYRVSPVETQQQQQQQQSSPPSTARSSLSSPRFKLPPTPLTSPDMTIVGEVRGAGEGCPDNDAVVLAPRAYSPPNDDNLYFPKRQIARSAKDRGLAAAEPATPSPTPAPAKLSVSDRKRLFENAMEEHLKPSPKPEKVFSFLSQDEVEKLKQEEEKKIATLTRDELKSWAQIDENEGLDDEDHVEDQDIRRPNSRLSSRSAIPVLQNVPSIVRTAKAERRLKEKMIQEGLLSDEDDDSRLSPADKRALEAEKRAAWRQARLKSLEQDALQAQMVIKKMSEMMDTSTKLDMTKELSLADQPDSRAVPPPQPAAVEVEKVPEVETLREKIISLELSNPDEEQQEALRDTSCTAAAEASESESEEQSSSAVETPTTETAEIPFGTSSADSSSLKTSDAAAGDDSKNGDEEEEETNGVNHGPSTATSNGAKKKKRKRSKKGRH